MKRASAIADGSPSARAASKGSPGWVTGPASLGRACPLSPPHSLCPAALNRLLCPLPGACVIRPMSVLGERRELKGPPGWIPHRRWQRGE